MRDVGELERITHLHLLGWANVRDLYAVQFKLPADRDAERAIMRCTATSDTPRPIPRTLPVE